MQVFSLSRQYKEDDLFVVVIGTQHHDSHRVTVLEGRLS